MPLGNGNNLLSDEYFPADANKVMGEELQEKTVMMYDFVTAYQNLLRDGQKPANREIILDQVKQSDDGKSGTVWTFAMENTSAEVIHFINLTGTDNLWRDENQTKPQPQPQAEIPVRVYTDFDMQTVYWATPDGDTLMPQALDFTVEQDAKGRSVMFKLPSLSYWSMVFMR